MAGALPPGWPPRERESSTLQDSVIDDDDDEHPKCSPCNRYRILVTPMFGMVIGIIGINYAPYVLWTPHATWLSRVALVIPLTLLQASITRLDHSPRHAHTSLRLILISPRLVLTSLRLVLTR